ncbi:rRNA-processing protein efg-1 [Apiospora hydei]|uniref:rRNA-processing protein EFG1 n=1 Tax=Apiospora hydei TaxID=1337664 RepID=A0ABR1WY28_9PEZI
MAGFKRKHSNGDAGESKPREYVPGLQAPKRRKNKNGKVVKVRPNNLNWVKKRARTIERHFRTGQNLPADKKNDLERELAHYKQKIEEANGGKQRKQMIKKYHMVRFFERKKADKLAKQIQKQLDACEDEEERKQLEKDLHVAQIDGQYARNFPYLEAYVSLYPVKSLGLTTQGGEQPETASTAAQALRNERPPLWHAIEKATEEGIPALIAIRERDIHKGHNRNSKKAKAQAAASSSAESTQKDVKMKDTNSAAKSDDDDGDDSDGGFFEGA